MSYRRTDYLYNDKNGVVIQPAKREDTHERVRVQQPVQLQPSWEENNLPEDELNFKSLTMDEASLQLNTPRDRYRLVYLTFLLHGIGVLMPWNMFITAGEYFTDYKLGKDYIVSGEVFPYLKNFMQLLTFSSQVPNVLFNWMNVFVHFGGNLTTRIVWSISIEVIVFIITIILAMLDSSEWPYTFFYITMTCVVLLNMANGVYQNTIFGMAANLPPKYSGAVILGSNISGTFASVVSILTNSFTDNKRMAAIYYFITALFVLLLCFDTYFALPLNRFYRHHELVKKKREEQEKQINIGRSEKVPYLSILKQASGQFYNIFFIMFVTLAVFPSLNSNIEHNNIKFLGDNFTSVTCFLTFNVTAMIGSFIAGFIQWPGPRFLWLPVTVRIFYIPFYIFCNYQVKEVNRTLPVLVENDYIYWIVGATMGLSSGYLSSLAMMYSPRTVEEKHASTAGMFAGAFLITGIFAGIIISFAWPWVISHIGY